MTARLALPGLLMPPSPGAGITSRKLPSRDVVQITDQTQTAGVPGQAGQFIAQGFGLVEPYDSNTRSISGDSSKTFHMLGQHTLSVGYTWQFPVYNDITKYSGGKFPLPSANASGGDPGYLNSTNPTVAGASSDAQLFPHTSRQT